MKGKLIVLCGPDGSGKATQTELLVARLQREGYGVETISFPQYGKTFFADLVQRYLRGEFGGVSDVSPYLASLLYAGDRWQAKEQLVGWLRAGKVVVSNRYVSANMGHQGAKIAHPRKRREFLRWLDKLEHDVFGLPRPDLNILLHVPASISQRLIAQRSRENGVPKDIHERDLKHLKQTESAYLEVARRGSNWAKIECVKKGTLRSREDIAAEVWRAVFHQVRKLPRTA